MFKIKKSTSITIFLQQVCIMDVQTNKTLTDLECYRNTVDSQ
jgi:hypothetical protein